MTISAEELHARIMRRVAANETRRAAPGTTYLDQSLLPHGAPEDVGLYLYGEEERRVKSYTPPLSKGKDLHRPASPRDAEGETGFARGVEEMSSFPSGDHTEDKDRHVGEEDRAPTKPRYRPTTPDEIAKLERAKEGLPDTDKITWMRVQMWDNGKKPGCTRFNLKITATARPPQHIDRREGNISRFCALSTLKQFRANVSRKKDIGPDERKIIDQSIEFVTLLNEQKEPDQPEALIGFIALKYKGLGTKRYPGQIGIVQWRKTDKGWEPEVNIVVDGYLVSVKMPYCVIHDHPAGDSADIRPPIP